MFDNLKSSFSAGILSGEIPTQKIALATTGDKASKELEKIKKREIRKKSAELDRIASAPDINDVEIVITYKKNRTWGWNPHAELYVNGLFVAKDRASGYGYDKTSAAMSYVLNKSDARMERRHCLPASASTCCVWMVKPDRKSTLRQPNSNRQRYCTTKPSR